MSVPIPDPPLPHDHLHVTPWPDPVIDALGHDPRSLYVEQFWLGILGPSTTWLLRRLVAGLEAEPAGFELPLADTTAPPPPRPAPWGGAQRAAATPPSCGRWPAACSSTWPRPTARACCTSAAR